MIRWYEGYNWTYYDFKRVVITALTIEDEEYVTLDVSHSDRKNMDDIICWAKEHGYKAEERSVDIIRVYK